MEGFHIYLTTVFILTFVFEYVLCCIKSHNFFILFLNILQPWWSVLEYCRSNSRLQLLTICMLCFYRFTY
jgi:hypothetical protein